MKEILNLEASTEMYYVLYSYDYLLEICNYVRTIWTSVHAGTNLKSRTAEFQDVKANFLSIKLLGNIFSCTGNNTST